MSNPPITEPQPPQGLEQIQQHFGTAMAMPFLFTDEEEDGFRLRKDQYPQEILDLMVPLPEKHLSGADRLGTYNRQYWFRLLTIMQKEYPLMMAMMGLGAFNRMVMDYLCAYPPSSPSLRDLSNHLVPFLNEDHEWNETFLIQAAELEFAYIQAFDAAHLPPLDLSQLSQEDQQNLLTQPLQLQPHLQFFREETNLMHWRIVVKAAEEPELVDVDLSPEPNHWAIWREDGATTAAQLGPLQWRILTHLQQGLSISEAIGETTQVTDEAGEQFISQHIGSWFAWWQGQGWFVGLGDH